VLVVVVKNNDAFDINTKNGPTKLKKIQVVDTSGKLCELTVWSNMIDQLEKLGDSLNNNVIIGLQGVSYKNHEQ